MSIASSMPCCHNSDCSLAGVGAEMAPRLSCRCCPAFSSICCARPAPCSSAVPENTATRVSLARCCTLRRALRVSIKPSRVLMTSGRSGVRGSGAVLSSSSPSLSSSRRCCALNARLMAVAVFSTRLLPSVSVNVDCSPVAVRRSACHTPQGNCEAVRAVNGTPKASSDSILSVLRRLWLCSRCRVGRAMSAGN